ncbi:hypothetical protein FRB99_004806 [Tulasnella sp. 403]|nr:hypothetical protein FRB99_004806 [Tulasnella sp. 403]
MRLGVLLPLRMLITAPSLFYAVSAAHDRQLGDTDSELERTFGKCPTFESIPVPPDLGDKVGDPTLFPGGVARKPFLLGRGLYGCVYGLESPSGEVILATKTVLGHPGIVEPIEIDSLKAIDEYYGETVFIKDDKYLYHFVFMMYHGGVRLYKTAGWEEFVSPPTEPRRIYKTRKAPWKDREKCEQFIELTVQLVASRAKEYAKKGAYHRDLNTRNILFQSDYPNNKDIAFVDWGVASRTSDPELV